jgi:predicted transcriptional regulator of viral defense system
MPVVPIFMNTKVQIELNSYQTPQFSTTCYGTPYFESGDSTTHLSIRLTYLLDELGEDFRLREPKNGVLRHLDPRRESNGKVKKPAE